MSDESNKSFLDRAGEGARGAMSGVSAMPTRRKLLLGGGTVLVVAGAGAGAALSSGGDDNGYVRAAKRAGADGVEDLGDGFVMVDGWILKKSDLEQMNLKR